MQDTPDQPPLTPAQRDDLVAALERGMRPRDAAAWAGVRSAAIKADLKRDADFARRFHRARLSIKLKHLDNIHHIREGNGWRVSAWYLASTYPEEFVRPQGRRPGASPPTREERARRDIQEQKSFANSYRGPRKRFQEFERITMDACLYDPPPRDGSPDRGPDPTEEPDAAPEEAFDEDAYRDDVDGPLPDEDQPHYEGPRPLPADLPVAEGRDGVLVPPPNCLVVDGRVLEDRHAGDERATIFADYDAQLYRWAAKEVGAPAVPMMQRWPVVRQGPYFERLKDGVRLVGRRELIERFRTINVQRYVWTGVTYEQSYPVRSNAWDPAPPAPVEAGGDDDRPP